MAASREWILVDLSTPRPCREYSHSNSFSSSSYSVPLDEPGVGQTRAFAVGRFSQTFCNPNQTRMGAAENEWTFTSQTFFPFLFSPVVLLGLGLLPLAAFHRQEETDGAEQGSPLQLTSVAPRAAARHYTVRPAPKDLLTHLPMHISSQALRVPRLSGQ